MNSLSTFVAPFIVLLTFLEFWTWCIFVLLPETWKCPSRRFLCWVIVNSVCPTLGLSDHVFLCSEIADKLVKKFWRTWALEFYFLSSNTGFTASYLYALGQVIWLPSALVFCKMETIMLLTLQVVRRIVWETFMKMS